MSSKLGLEGVLYRNTGTHGSPTWNEMDNVKDLSLGLSKSEADVTTRGNNGWRAMRGVLKEGTIEFQAVWDTEDEDLMAMFDAWLNDTPIEVLCLDGPIDEEGSQGLRATMEVMSVNKTEPLEEAQMVAVIMKPTYAANPPVWYEVEGSGS